jgi:hypothetical protein
MNITKQKEENRRKFFVDTDSDTDYVPTEYNIKQKTRLIKYFRENVKDSDKLSDKDLIAIINKYVSTIIMKKTLNELNKRDRDILVRLLSTNEIEILKILLEDLSIHRLKEDDEFAKDEDIGMSIDKDSSIKKRKSKNIKKKKEKKRKSKNKSIKRKNKKEN